MIKNKLWRLSVSLLVLVPATLVGCSTLKASVSPAYQGKMTEVARIGVAGEGATGAAPAFQAEGYMVIDIGSDTGAPMEAAKRLDVPFVAIIDAVGTDGAWWDSVFDYSMRVTETSSGQIVWSGRGEFGEGLVISQTSSTSRAMLAMVKDFKRNFPPAPTK